MTSSSALSAWTQGRLPIVLVGPTATGKTEAAVALAEMLDGEIINADSMQVYRGLDIGTAKPDAIARKRTPFHLLDVANPDQQVTAADWKAGAEAAIEDIFRRGKQPIVCGGTGLYVRALLDDWSMAATPADVSVRAQLQQEVNTQGAAALHVELARLDPETAARLHPNDGMRIIRALEVYRVTGKPISVYQAEDRRTRRPRTAHRFGLTLPRPELYMRIDRRADTMMEAGLELEIRGLLAAGYSPDLASMRSLGYKEITSAILGKTTLEAAIADVKQNTRRFAKRQQTWFRADTLIHWIDVAALNSKQVAEFIQREITGHTEPQI